jgi:hypothetical protein
MAIAKGTQVRQVVTPVYGVVNRYEVDQETGQLQYLVVWADENGNEQSKFFREGEIEVAPVEP